MKTLAIKYRPQTWDEVTEQESIKIILQEQLDTGTIKNAYLFCGGAGTGKTTCARIFANEINKGKGNPIEMDAASNSGVDDVRNITQQAKLKSMDSEYKIFIIDECHAISNTGWQAFLKLIEEPPAKSIFIFCTTDPQKIPKTILSRVQRYDFKRISQFGIVQRLKWICDNEGIARYSDNGKLPESNYATQSALDYIAKIADGGMRDAITMMDKCLSYSNQLTLENVVKALGTVDYDIMMKLTDAVLDYNSEEVLKIIDGIHAEGKDIKQFLALYVQFLLDIQKFKLTKDFKYTQLPGTDSNEDWLNNIDNTESYDTCFELLSILVKLNASIKWSQTAKYDLEAELLLFTMEE
jgi:DNA polymerase-3 subunit gamma/tau